MTTNSVGLHRKKGSGTEPSTVHRVWVAIEVGGVVQLLEETTLAARAAAIGVDPPAVVPVRADRVPRVREESAAHRHVLREPNSSDSARTKAYVRNTPRTAATTPGATNSSAITPAAPPACSTRRDRRRVRRGHRRRPRRGPPSVGKRVAVGASHHVSPPSSGDPGGRCGRVRGRRNPTVSSLVVTPTTPKLAYPIDGGRGGALRNAMDSSESPGDREPRSARIYLL